MMMSWIAVKGDPIDWFKVWDAVGSSIDVFTVHRVLFSGALVTGQV